MSSTVSSSFYRASLIDPPGATPFAVNPNPHNTTAPSTPQRPAPTRRFSSASVIAQITLLGYPPKIQPQSSATRDQGREQQQFLLQQPSPIINNHESCILIALANHDPNSNGKKLLPATPTTATATTTAKIMTADAVSTTSTASSSSTSTASCDNSPSSTSTKSSLATHNGNSMSIRNLLGGGSSSDHAAELILKPSLHRDPESSADSKNGSNGHVTWQKDDDDEDDPIMILAAAAAVINDQDQAKGSLHATHGYEQHHHCNDAPSNNSRSKRKWHGYHVTAISPSPRLRKARGGQTRLMRVTATILQGTQKMLFRGNIYQCSKYPQASRHEQARIRQR
ncbi:hypothetical protein BX666DRAFT_816852 [Dichotomocladium elegans]|nr:hypothetical protein BX666DRAFT_816852 [Dichotomocladium elegans]